MFIAVVTLFPEMFSAITQYGVGGRAVERAILSIKCVNPREFTEDRHQTVDDRPYGGGPGMVMMVEPLQKAVEAAQAWLVEQTGYHGKVVYLSPQGENLTQAKIEAQCAQQENLVLIAGRYEGVDERFIDAYVDEELSIGDYVLSGGELPAMVLIDVMTRLLPGVLGDDLSAQQDSFVNGLLDCPHYTRPPVYQDREVPKVLLSGDHEKIRQWRLQQSLIRTCERRPDLLSAVQLDEEQAALLNAYKDGKNAV